MSAPRRRISSPRRSPSSRLSAPAHGATLAGFLAVLLAACALPQTTGTAASAPTLDHQAARRRMVAEQIAARDVTDPRVLAAMREVPRHLFVPPGLADRAYDDEPLPIGQGQTISQPYVVALMAELADLEPGDRVLEIGTGSGYHAAVMARMADRVFSIEILPELAAGARATLAVVGVANVSVRVGDGYRGWPEEAPFDAIVLTAAPAEIPQPLLDQLADGGRLVAPVGEQMQHLTVITRQGGRLERELVAPVRFVPMTGEARRPRDGG